MVRRALLGLTVLAGLTMIDTSSAEAGGCRRGRSYHGGHHYGGYYRGYGRPYHGGHGYYSRSYHYGPSYYRGYGGYGCGRSGVSFSIGF